MNTDSKPTLLGAQQIIDGLTWSAPKVINTAKGIRQLQTAVPNPNFWGAWRRMMAIGVCRKGGRICVVGDDRQAIYGFRGACPDGLDMMQAKLNAQVLGLTVTYRCPKSVVKLASEIVTDYQDQAAPSAPEGTIGQIAESILPTMLQPGDAVLSRVNAPLMPLCLSLLRKGVAAMIVGRDIGTQLAGIVKSLKARSVPQFIQKVETWGAKQKNRFAGSKHFESKAEQINDQVATLTAVAEGASNVAEIESRLLNLFQDTDGNSKPSVVLSSVHKAKGLEWNRVVLISETFKRRNESTEEANIYYVAITRAKSELLFSSDDSKSAKRN